jgi:deferrochelatase/peroxidase EfeB
MDKDPVGPLARMYNDRAGGLARVSNLSATRRVVTVVKAMKVDIDNVQGSIVQVIRRPLVRHLILHFGDPMGARAFVRQLLPRITTAAKIASAPDPLLNVSLTAGGLEALGLNQALLRRFDAVFLEGPDPRRLGDIRASPAESEPWWEGQFQTPAIHCIVHLFARSQSVLDRSSGEIREQAGVSGVQELIPRRDGSTLDSRSLGGRRLHFGYVDGISQPPVAWDDDARQANDLDFRNFVLGYSTRERSSAPSSGPAADLARDGAYAAFLWYYQDAAAFARFLAEAAPAAFPALAADDAQELLAAKLLGRWRDGTPLVLSPDHPDASLIEQNTFGYRSEDPEGHRCPFSAHMRVMNPRDQPLDPVTTEGVPRVLRRGMPYGPVLEGTDDDHADRGFFGVFVCSDIRRQIYTLATWMKQNNFSPVFNEDRRSQDALVGNRGLPGASTGFRIPAPGGDVRIPALPDFVKAKGAAFVIYPSWSMLDALTASP